MTTPSKEALRAAEKLFPVNQYHQNWRDNAAQEIDREMQPLREAAEKLEQQVRKCLELESAWRHSPLSFLQTKLIDKADALRTALAGEPVTPSRDGLREIAVEALNELQSMRKQIIHGGAWTKKIDDLFERARKAGL